MTHGWSFGVKLKSRLPGTHEKYVCNFKPAFLIFDKRSPICRSTAHVLLEGDVFIGGSPVHLLIENTLGSAGVAPKKPPVLIIVFIQKWPLISIIGTTKGL